MFGKLYPPVEFVVGFAGLVGLGVRDLDGGAGHREAGFVGDVADERTVERLSRGWDRQQQGEREEKSRPHKSLPGATCGATL